MTESQTQYVGLLGWPLDHSLSPVMHNAAFEALDLNWRYLAMPVRPDQLAPAVHGLAALGFRGANITIPHKQAVLPFIDWVSPDAQEIGAVNTLVIENPPDLQSHVCCRGYNTDVPGFLQALRWAGYDPAQEHGQAVVVGAGGSARAVCRALLDSGIRHLIVLNRSLEHAHQMTDGLKTTATITVLPLTNEILVETTRKSSLLVHTTPLGTWPRTDQSIWPEGTPMPGNLFVFDLVYNPVETHLLEHARRSGARAINGLEMLIRQGSLSFELWTGHKPPLEVMRRACQEKLNHRG